MFVLFSGVQLLAQNPNWQAPEGLQFSMSVTATVTVEGSLSEDGEDILAAFIGNEVRGVTQPIADDSGRFLYFLTILYDAANGGPVTFKWYDHSQDQVFLLKTQIEFANDNVLGTIGNPYVITDNDAPVSISLSTSSITEALSIDETALTLSTTDTDEGDTHSYLLVSGTGDEDNTSFSISDNSLIVAGELDYESNPGLSVRIRSTDQGGLSLERDFQIEITDANDQPTGIVLESRTVEENQTVGTVIGTLSSVDQDAVDSFTYTLVEGSGDGDNGLLSIDEDQLIINGAIDFEVDELLNFRIRTTDAAGAFVEDSYEWEITDANDAPTDITALENRVAIHAIAGQIITQLKTEDPDQSDSFDYALLEGDNDNFWFALEGDLLKVLHLLPDSVVFNVELSSEDASGETIHTTIEIETVTLFLSSLSVEENLPEASFVGTMAVSGLTEATYEFVPGYGDDDNTLFQLEEGKLLTKEVFDHETQASYTIRVAAISDDGFRIERSFLIAVENANDQPSAINISESFIAASAEISEQVAILSTVDQDEDDEFVYSLVSGFGDNSRFTIQGDQLFLDAAIPADQDSLSLSVISLDHAGDSVTSNFVLFLSSIDLSQQEFAENADAATFIGILKNSTDPEANYELVQGHADDDNDLFQISGDSLKTKTTFNYEEDANLSIRVRSISDRGPDTERSFTIRVIDRNELPTDLLLSENELPEFTDSGTLVGLLLLLDPDLNDVFTYEFEAGEGDENNETFELRQDSLFLNGKLNFELESTLSIRISGRDQSGVTITKSFVIQILNENDSPESLVLDTNEIEEGRDSGTFIGSFSVQDEDEGDSHQFALVSGEGETDNDSFFIQDDQLHTVGTFDFDQQSLYTIRVRASDTSNERVEAIFDIFVKENGDAVLSIVQQVDLVIFPNPTIDWLFFDAERAYDYKIYDARGLLQLEGTTTRAISVEDLNAGIYMLQLKYGNELISKRFVKR